MEEILHQAKQPEKSYDWLGAAESYKKALNLLSENDFSRKGDITERLGYAFYRAAFQAEKNDEFKEKIHQSVAYYLKAKEFFERSGEPQKTPRILRCRAMIAYSGYWLASEVSEKKRLLDECWKTTKEALKAFDEAKDALEYGRTYNQLSSSVGERFALEWSFQARARIIKEALEQGERAIDLLLGISDPHELAKAYVKTAVYLSFFGVWFASDMDEKDGYFRKGLGYWQKANELSEEAAYLELLTLPGVELDWPFDEMLALYGKALVYAKKTKDKYLVGFAFEWMKYIAWWTWASLEDPDEMRKTVEDALQYAKDAKDRFSTISYIGAFPVYWSGAPYAEYYQNLASFETDPGKKRELLQKAIVEHSAAIKRAEDAGYPFVVIWLHCGLGSCLVSLAKTEANAEEKKRLLEPADANVEKEMELRLELDRFNYWTVGWSLQHLADLKAELSQVETDAEKRKNLLEEAVSHQKHGLELCIKWNSHWEKIGDLTATSRIGTFQYVCGERLNLLYGLTRDEEFQKEALNAFKDSAESYQKLEIVSRVAESYWKVATSYDVLGEHLKAAESFNLASDNYKRAAEKIPQLKDLYQDHAGYMQAWREIEAARDHHKRQEYDAAKEHFEKAANFHTSLKQWSYLAPNYFAWARLEEAEELSRKERTEEAVKAFENVVTMFIQSTKYLQKQLDKIEDPDEKQMAVNVINATDTRKEYSAARIAVEEARLLDKKGDHYRSSEKYASAAEAFEKIGKTLESEQEQREFRLILALSRSWQTMTLAEAEASPALYVKASKLFEEAREFSPNEKTKMLLLGHSRFCKALEAGTEFADSRNMDMYVGAVRYLESAASYYVKAGFPKASEYSEATKLLLDAYMHTESAGRESDPEKKVKLYGMAEKVLQMSADSFMRADHPEKREQVLGLLEKVKKEQEVATSLMEVLHAPSIVSTTTAFSTPVLTYEQAVGSERFEHADIQASVILRQKNLKVGDSLELEIVLVNAGKGHGLLIKLAEVIPEGFELTQKPEIYRVEDSFLNMKGRRLDPLKTEEVRLVLKPKAQGVFSLRPRIDYLDENGKYKSHEPHPVTITVKELGIKGWLKGEK